MRERITITTLVENTVNIGGLRSEHGLAFLLRTGGQKLMFDTGQSDLLLHNARQMGLILEDLDGIVLSHGHYDHTGGLEAICKIAPRARIFLHPAAVRPKFTQNADGTTRSIGMKEETSSDVIGKAAVHERANREVTGDSALVRSSGDSETSSSGGGGDAQPVVWTTRPQEVMDGIWVTGEIPRRTSFEDTGGRFYQDATCTRPDPLLDDQALYFETPQGVVVVLGCGHAGVVNTLEQVFELTRGKPIHAVLGGMHLMAASSDRIDRTLEDFRRWSIKKFFPAHCTGMFAAARLWAAFPERCSPCPVGTRMEFEKT